MVKNSNSLFGMFKAYFTAFCFFYYQFAQLYRPFIITR